MQLPALCIWQGMGYSFAMMKLKQRIVAALVRRQFGKSDRKRDAGKKTPLDVARYDDILYGNDRKFAKWQLLDVYRPKAAVTAGGGLAKLPVIVIVHGGGWVYGDKDVYQFYGMSLAQKNFAVVNYSYRLAPEAKFPASLEDTEKVFAWICENAEAYGFDTRNVFAVGDSAGGHLLSLYASALSNREYGKNFPFIKEKNLVLRAVALNCGKYNMDDALKNSSQTRALMEALLPASSFEKDLPLLNGDSYVTKDFPPAFVMTCMGDFLREQAPFMVKALEKAGVKHVYKCYGTEVEPLWHVFHCNPDLEQAEVCNRNECEFFNGLLER